MASKLKFITIQMIPLTLISLKNTSIFEQLQLEEALLRADDRNWCLINSGSPRAIVMGISGKPEVLINQDLLTKDPVPVIRRFSGGGTVFIDPNTVFVTWILNAGAFATPCCPQKIHRWSENFYQKALPFLNLKLMENDYAIGERKFGGNAQYLCKNRWLHHSSLLWDYDIANMDYLLMPPKIPAYRQGRTHDEFLCRLREHVPDKNQLQNHIIEALQKRFEVQSITWEEAQQVQQRPHRKATQYVAM